MSVYITRASKHLPNHAVGNDDIERYLGMINGCPSKARSLILRRNGIKQRYYALNERGEATDTNVGMAAKAVAALCDEHFSVDDIDVLACGTASPEQLVPSHGVQVHGELGGNGSTEVVSFAGSCCTGVQALKYAYMSVSMDPSLKAVAVASERLSAWMRASYFQQESERLEQLSEKPMLAFEKEFLRWMLSDGAFALLVEGKPRSDALSLRIDWIELTSFANTQETCMYAGGEKDADGKLHGWASFPENEWLTLSLFAVKQDTRLLEQSIVPLGYKFLLQLSEKHHFKADDIDWFLPHLSSMYFKEKILSAMKDFYIDESKWFVNLPTVGNIASASAFAMLEELLGSGKLQRGQKILMMIPESARFSYCYCMLTVC